MSRPKSNVNKPEGGASGRESSGRWSSGVGAGGEEQQLRISGGRCEQAVDVSWHVVREPAVGVSRPESVMSRAGGRCEQRTSGRRSSGGEAVAGGSVQDEGQWQVDG